MTENKSPFARLMVDENGKPYIKPMDSIAYTGFTLAADGDKTNGDTRTPQDLEIIHRMLPEVPKAEPSI